MRATSRLRGGARARALGLALGALVGVLGLLGAPGTALAAGARRVMGLYPTPVAGAPAGPALPMVDSQIELVVRGPVVEAVVTQRFTNPTARPIEATYIFPLPADAAVSALAITTGARTIHAAIARRDEAQRRYEDAVRAGVAAVVLDQERPDVFTQTIAAIPAGASVVVRLRYDTVARFGDGTWALVLPLVVAPRYVPGTASGRATTGVGRAPDTDRAPDASRITPGASPRGGGATAVRLAFVDAVMDLSSPTHELVVQGPLAASLVDPRSDHDMVIRWRAAAPAGGWLEVGADGGGIAAVVVEAPAAPLRTGALRVVLVLDRAATMTGDAQIAAQPLVRGLFAALGPEDRVALMGDPVQGFGPPVDGLAAVERAWTRAGGPFDLTRVLAAARPAGAPLVLVSDGLVADDDAALAAARALRVPVHVIGVGPAPNRGLLTRLAATTSGTARFVLPGDDLAAIARAAIADVAGPASPLTVSWGTLSAREVVPALLPRLGAGQAMLVLARVGRAQRANARARGELIALQELPGRRRSTVRSRPRARWRGGGRGSTSRTCSPVAATPPRSRCTRSRTAWCRRTRRWSRSAARRSSRAGSSTASRYRSRCLPAWTGAPSSARSPSTPPRPMPTSAEASRAARRWRAPARPARTRGAHSGRRPRTSRRPPIGRGPSRGRGRTHQRGPWRARRPRRHLRVRLRPSR